MVDMRRLHVAGQKEIGSRKRQRRRNHPIGDFLRFRAFGQVNQFTLRKLRSDKASHRFKPDARDLDPDAAGLDKGRSVDGIPGALSSAPSPGPRAPLQSTAANPSETVPSAGMISPSFTTMMSPA